MQRDNPMVDMGSRTDFPPCPIPTVQLEPRAPSAASRSAPARRLLPCTSGTGLPRTAGGRWPGSSSRRTGSCLRGRKLCSPRARGAPHHRVPRAQPGAPNPAQDLRLRSRAGNARSLLHPAAGRSWPSCGSPREDRSSLSMKTSRGPRICSTTPVSVRCVSGGTARFCLALPSGTHTPRPLTKTGQASDYLRGSRCCS